MDYAKVEDENIYKDDKHKLDIIETIVNKSAGKFRLNAPQGDTHEVILSNLYATVASPLPMTKVSLVVPVMA